MTQCVRMKTFIFDWKQTLYDPDNRQLIDGALDVLEFLKAKPTRMVLFGKGSQDMHAEVQRLGVAIYFLHINFTEGPKEPMLFEPFVDEEFPEDTVFIGDRVKSELVVGNSLGATTIWIKRGEFAAEVPEGPVEQPTHTFGSLQELKEFLEQLL